MTERDHGVFIGQHRNQDFANRRLTGLDGTLHFRHFHQRSVGMDGDLQLVTGGLGDIGHEFAASFASGLYFAFEDLTSQPAELELLGPRLARLSIIEGRYHQVKRMFGHFNNKVIGLHRERMGPLRLDMALAPGEYRALSEEEIRQV